MNQSGTILYVDDEKANLDIFLQAFQKEFPIKTALSGEEAYKILLANEVAILIADQRMPGMSGVELCEKVFQVRPETIRIILTAYSNTEILLAAIRQGHVQDYIVKPWDKSTLKPILEKFLEEYRQKKEKIKELELRSAKVQSLEDEVQRVYDNRGIVGFDSGLKSIMETVKKAAPSDSSILLIGETGTGKELLARAIHMESKRRGGPFVPVHCAAFAATLIESELFGHEKGAFTGANQTRAGRFELANGGTIFLDEIGEVPLEAQVKLLRVLQEREIQRVGGNQDISVDVRLVAATHKNLEEEVRQGRFREDLLYRIKVITISVPSLRDRKEDIPALANYFLRKYAGKTGARVILTPEAIQHLQSYDWPGNVRELENIIERAVILSTGPTIDPEDLNLPIEEMLRTEKVDVAKIAPPGKKSVRTQIQEKEIQHLTDTLTQAGGNIAEAARILGIARSTMFHRLKKFQII